jgi:hypothetical protein
LNEKIAQLQNVTPEPVVPRKKPCDHAGILNQLEN